MIEEQMFSIAEVSRITGYEPHVIRFYEKEFNIQVPRNKSNHRYFTQKEIDKFLSIKRLQEKGYSNTQIKMIFTNPDLLTNFSEEITDLALATLPNSSGYYGKQMEESLIHFKEEIIKEFQDQFHFQQEPYRMALIGLAEEVKDLSKAIHTFYKMDMRMDNDIILCENAKLKMQIQQKTNEIAGLKEQIKRAMNKKPSLFKLLFKNNN